MVFGKPNPSILLELRDRLNCKLEEMLMVGDRIYTDMKMAQEAGVPAALVLTGEARIEQLSDLVLKPDFIIDDVGQLGEMLVRRKTKCTNDSLHSITSAGGFAFQSTTMQRLQ